MLTREDHKTYAQILREELTPAFGCTEPIALAYCAAKAREVLGQMPTEVIIVMAAVLAAVGAAVFLLSRRKKRTKR